MQRVLVMDNSLGDYVHDDERIVVEHLRSHQKYELLVKDLGADEKKDGSVAILFPASLIENISMQGDYCVLVLAPSTDKAMTSRRAEEITRMVQGYGAKK